MFDIGLLAMTSTTSVPVEAVVTDVIVVRATVVVVVVVDDVTGIPVIVPFISDRSLLSSAPLGQRIKLGHFRTKATLLWIVDH